MPSWPALRGKVIAFRRREGVPCSSRSSKSEILVNIPLIVKLPSSTGLKGERRRDVAQHIDVVPTILDYLGIEKPKHLEGISLLPAIFLKQESHRTRRVFSYVADGFEAGASVVDFPWKFIWNSVSGPNEQLFNMETDPREKADLSSEYPLRAKYLKAMIKVHWTRRNRTGSWARCGARRRAGSGFR